MDPTLHKYGLTFEAPEEEEIIVEKDIIDEEFKVNISELRRAYDFYEECRSAGAGQAYDDSAGMMRVDSSYRDSMADSYPRAVASVRSILKRLNDSELEKFLSKHDFGRRMDDELGFIYRSKI